MMAVSNCSSYPEVIPSGDHDNNQLDGDHLLMINGTNQMVNRIKTREIMKPVSKVLKEQKICTNKKINV
ncbi:unnamed protein product [Heterobilharzia americana]|nr:unnamed protein product [Heterobilharzia americana]